MGGSTGLGESAGQQCGLIDTPLLLRHLHGRGGRKHGPGQEKSATEARSSPCEKVRAFRGPKPVAAAGDRAQVYAVGSVDDARRRPGIRRGQEARPGPSHHRTKPHNSR